MLLSFPKQALYSIWVTLELLHSVETLRELPVPSRVRRNRSEKLCWGLISVSKYVVLATPSIYKGNQQLLYRTTLPLCLSFKQVTKAR